MLFWVAAAVLTILCVAAALFPLLGAAGRAEAPEARDLEVYKDQLAEIARDRDAGTLSAGDSEAARAEVARRILKSSSQAGAGSALGAGRQGRVAAIAIAGLLPLLSWSAYSLIGAPELADQPISSRQASEGGSIESLVAKAEAHLAKNPDDGRGWDVLAPIYVRMGRFENAVTAFSRAIALNEPRAARQSGFGEALTGAAGGKVMQEAKAAFAKALALDPKEPKALLFIAMGLMQEGKTAEAKTALQSQLEGLAGSSQWRPVVERALASLENASQGGIEKGPSQADVDAAGQMSGADRLAMIETMVAGLAERLKAEPDNLSDWQKLIRSYMVLGKKDKALEALENAQIAFKDDEAKRGSIRAFAKELGLSGS